MKVRVSTTLNVDVEAWCMEYGTDAGEVREDVKAYADHVLYEYFRDLGVLADD